MEGAEGHIRELLAFVGSHRWVWDVQVTRLFAEQWWERVPVEWREPMLQLNQEELSQLPCGLTKSSWPDGLRRFVEDSLRLSLTRAPPEWVVRRAVPVERGVAGGMTPKKAHEVSRLAGVVVDVCRRMQCQLVLDVGAGLGYLGRCLCNQCGVSVVGVERERERAVSATKRGQPGASCDSHVTLVDESDWSDQLAGSIPHDLSSPFHVTLALTVDDSMDSRQKVTSLLDCLQALNKGPVGVCMVGLHCCGDLTPSVLKLFTTNPSLNSTVVVGCCYHRMAVCCHDDRSCHDNGSVGSQFINFPLSTIAKELLATQCRGGGWEVNVFAMRLAAQETKERWKQQSPTDHGHHSRQVAFRAITEAVCGGQGLPRKALRGLPSLSFEEYAETVARNLNRPDVKQQLLGYHSSHKQYIPYIEPFTALQVCMQGVLESLVLVDRWVYLREHGLETHLVPLFDEHTSPRNMAIVATRKKL